MQVLKCSKGLMAIAVMGFFLGCGDSGNKVFSFPQSAIEVKAIYDNSPEILENPLASGFARNLDVAINVIGDFKVVINRKGKEIYSQINGRETYLLNWFTEQGKYLLLVREYLSGSYTGTSKIFIDGGGSSVRWAGE